MSTDAIPGQGAPGLPTGPAGEALRPGTRLDYLDSLRAIAVFVVFVVHVTEVFVRVTAKQKGLYEVSYALNLGRVGVVTFFAISGFLIPSSLNGPVRTGLRRFLITRVCRLYPAYLVSLVPSLATYTLMTQGKHIDLSDALWNITMVPRLFGAPLANGAYWTLEVELAFYLLCALLFYAGVLRNSVVLASLMFGTFALFYSSQRLILGGLLNPNLDGDTFFFWLNVSCMFWGALIRRWWDGERLDWLSLGMIATVSLYWLVWLPGALAAQKLGLVAWGLDSRLIAGYAIGLWLFALGLFVIRIRVWWVGWLGRISYSFYLTHQAGLYIPFWLMLHHPRLQHRSMMYYLLASTVTSIMLAAASYYRVEQPSIRLGRRLTGRTAGRVIDAPAVAAAARTPVQHVPNC